MTVREDVLLRFRADTTQMRKGLGSMRDRATSVANSINEIGDALGRIGGAVNMVLEASNRTAAFQQKLAQTGELSFRRLQQATTDLITEQQALELTVRLNNGAFEITQEQMEIAGKAAVILGQQTGDLNKALDKVTQALVEGNVEALKEYGIQATGASDTQSGFNGVMAKFNDLLVENSDFAERSGTETQRAGTRWKDALDELVRQLGRIAQALTPIINRIAQVIEGLNDFARHRDLLETGRDTRLLRAARLNELRTQYINARLPIPPELEARYQQLTAGLESETRDYIKSRGLDTSGVSPDATGGGRGGKGSVQSGGAGGPARIERLDVLGGPGSTATGRGFAGSLGGTGGELRGLDALAFQVGNAGEFIELKDVVVESLGEMSEAAKQFQAAMEIVGASITSAFEQWGAGAISLGDAIKQAIGNAIADVLLGEAKKHAALAAADFKIGNVLGGTGHLAAAAGLSASSGAVRSFLVGSSGGPGAAGGGLPGAAAGASGAGSSTRSEVIVLGGDPLDDDPRAARRRLNKLLERAQREGGSGTTVVRA